MTDTPNLALPLLAAAQAQKHVTVNEALGRLDALVHLCLLSVTETEPPMIPVEGAAYGVPVGAVNAWDGHAGRVAIFVNGGWDFAMPQVGWRAFVVDAGAGALFDGAAWIVGALALSGSGAATLQWLVEIDHVVGSGPDSYTSVLIDNGMIVLGVTGRVVEPLTGSGLTGWSLGVDGAPDRYGSQHGLAQNTYVSGPTTHPQTYWGGTALRLGAEGGTFSSGRVRIAVHGLQLTPPNAI
jgi:hypothetical protein